MTPRCLLAVQQVTIPLAAVKSHGQAAQFRSWAARFDTGFAVGVGVPVAGNFDEFEPASPSSVVLIIDALENIDFVNWT